MRSEDIRSAGGRDRAAAPRRAPAGRAVEHAARRPPQGDEQWSVGRPVWA